MKFTEDFIKEQLDVMEKFEKAECSSSPEYLAGRNAATQNYADALRKIVLLEYEVRSWCRDMSAVFDEGKKRVIEAERKVVNLHIDSLYDEGYKLQQRIAELEYQLEDWTNNGWAEDYKARIAELERDVKWREESISTIEHALANNEDDIEMLESRIAELEATQRWIPVSERLPEATEYVYAVVYDAIDNTSKVSMLKHYGDGNWFSWESERYIVTHWMPLPELPKECE